MARPALEVADLFRRHGPSYRQHHRKRMTGTMVKVMRAIELCRTAALGGHRQRCDSCGYEHQAHNSCRNRHCPKCQASAKARWLQARQEELLPVTYFHVVFTIPACLSSIALHNKRVVYNILFRTASKTLQTIGRDPRHLGAELGFFGILHTWGQQLQHHPHLHFVVPGGGLSPDRSRWITRPPVRSRRKRTRKPFLLPVRVLSRLFRRLFLEELQRAFDTGRLKLAHIALDDEPLAFSRLMARARQTDWVVYAKKPFGGPEKVLDYLSRYTHRVAISNHRLLSLRHGKVTFRWHDYRTGLTQPMTLDAHEFIRRFLLHVLPDGFVRIRHYGLFANCHRAENLKLCRQLLERPSIPDAAKETSAGSTDLQICPRCHKGHLVLIQLIPAFHVPDPSQPGRAPP